MSNEATRGRSALIALAIGNMLGAGVFTTSGFAMGDLGSAVLTILSAVILYLLFGTKHQVLRDDSA